MKWTPFILAVSASPVVLGKPATTKRQQEGFQWVGANESGAEFGEDTIPGELDEDYIWPETAAISTLMESGLNIFRIAFMMERLFPESLTGAMDETYLGDLTATINFVTEQGAHAIVDPHNFGRYFGNIIESADDFGAFWATLAANFADNELVVFDTNNEYHDMDQTLVLDLNQAAIDGIRGAGATTQYIFVEGNSYSGAWTWTDVNDNLKALTDPSDLIVYEMHQYLDQDGSGTNEACVSETIGSERVTEATEWLRANGKKGIIGEFAGAVNDVCQAAVTGMLDYMAENTDVWTGAIWWAAGPWWADYMFSLEPGSGVAVEPYLPVLQGHVA